MPTDLISDRPDFERPHRSTVLAPPVLAPPVRLTVAGHFVRTRRVGGAEQMLYNLLQGFAVRGVDTTLMCGSQANLSDRFLTQFPASGLVRVRECGGTGVRFIAEQRACLTENIVSDAMLFPNYFGPPFIPRRLGRVGVVIHDFQYRHFPEYFSAKKRAWLRMAQAFSIRKADRVIVISDFVRQDAIRWFGDGIADKLSVVPNALCWDRFADGMGQPRPGERPYILSVAAQYPHKNLETLIRAFAIVARGNSDIQLVLCGQSYNGLHGVSGTRTGVAPLIEELGLKDRVELTGFVDDAMLARWYQHAEMFAFPSIFEGFGLPPVEAIGFGLPTLTTAETAMPEITMGNAVTVSVPLDPEEWADKIITILSDRDRYRPDSVAIANLKAFYDPARIAAGYLAALMGQAWPSK